MNKIEGQRNRVGVKNEGEKRDNLTADLAVKKRLTTMIDRGIFCKY